MAVVKALLSHGAKLANRRPGVRPTFTANTYANRLVIRDPFAFLLAVIFDHGIAAERAWEAPWLLKQRLGYLDPQKVSESPQSVRRAVALKPALHRFPNNLSNWVIEAGKRVMTSYGGDAGAVWSDTPRVEDVHARLQRFKGIGQKKAAMAVEILARDLGVPFQNLAGTEPAVDVHIRRVFLRTGLASIDSMDAILAAAKSLHPDRPGEIDYPAWEVGRNWCRPRNPSCAECAIEGACPKLISRANHVRGV
jgi:uncharacterized HhH-GPD family protein